MNASEIRALIVKERDDYQRLIDKGKGTWPNPDYVRDETWAYWQGALSALDHLLTQVPEPSAQPPLSEDALTKLGQAMLADYPETDYLPSRGEIAMHAMQGLLAESSDAWPAEAAARNAVMYADALLAELSKSTGLE